MTVMKNYEASWDDESSHVEDLRLSVASLLRGDDDVWEEAEEMIPEGHSAVLVEGLDSKRTSRCWGLDVMSDIFETFGMEYANATWEEVDTPRGSLIAKRPGRITGEQDQQNKQEITPTHDANIADVDTNEQKQYVEIYDPTEIDLSELLDNEEPLYQREQLPAQVEYDVEESQRHVFPISPPESIEESSCSPCSPCSTRPSPIRFHHHLPTPPTSPGSIYSQPTSLMESHLSSEDCPECKSPASSKTVSLLHIIKARFRRQTSNPKVRSTNAAPIVSPSPAKSTPVSLKPAPPQRPMSSVTKASGDDLRALLRGPTLKLNRLSDISLRLSPEEREQIARNRATNPKGTEDFDLIVTLGPFRTSHPTPRPSISSKAEDMAMSNLNSSQIPPVPFIDPEYLINSPVASNSSPAETGRPASIKKPRRRMSRRLRNRRPALPKVQDDTDRRSSGSGVRNDLSEENLTKLNSSISRSGPPLPSPLQRLTDLIHPQMKGLESPFTTRRLVASQAAETISTISPLPLPPLSPGPKKRRNRYPRADQFPLAQTTALGLKGGRVGVVQMGSPTKANKILGDLVLMVPEKDGRKRRTRGREATPSVSSGSIAKVEKLRGERITVDALHSPKEADGRSILIRPESKGAVWIV